MFTNYRPISLLPAASKVFERVIHDQLYSYFEENHLFNKSQYMDLGKKHSTELVFLQLTDKLYAQSSHKLQQIEQSYVVCLPKISFH